MNQTYIHSSRPGENHETSPCVGKAAFWVAEVDNFGREGESLMLHSRPPYMQRCFYLNVGIWESAQKNYGERVTFTSFTTDPGVPKNVIVSPFQNVDLFFNLLRPPFTFFAHISGSPSSTI